MSNHGLSLSLLDGLAAPELQRHALRTLMENADPSAGLRATFVQPLHDLMSAQSDPVASAYDAARARFPHVPPYSFVPIIQLVALLALSATLLYPRRPLKEGTNQVFSDYVARMRDHPNTQQVIVASGGDLLRYLEVVTESSGLWYNFGQRAIERVEPTHARLSYVDYDADLAAYWVPGLNRGLLRMFEQPGRVLLEPIDARRFCLLLLLESP